MMQTIQNHFDDLYFTESRLGKPMVTCGNLIVPVSGVYVLQGHPLAEKGGGPFKGKLIFKSVKESYRKSSEYIGDPRKPEGFKPTEEVRDEFADNGVSHVKEFGFEGLYEDPPSWVEDWIVQAESFAFEVED